MWPAWRPLCEPTTLTAAIAAGEAARNSISVPGEASGVPGNGSTSRPASTETGRSCRAGLPGEAARAATGVAVAPANPASKAALDLCGLKRSSCCRAPGAPRRGDAPGPRASCAQLCPSAPPPVYAPEGEGAKLRTMRLAKYLAARGVASRRSAERLIQAGRVSVNGATVTDPACSVTGGEAIAVDGCSVPPQKPHVVYAVNKPAGVVSTASDPHGRPTVVDLIESPARLYPVGRLDIDTTGLILLT